MLFVAIDPRRHGPDFFVTLKPHENTRDWQTYQQNIQHIYSYIYIYIIYSPTFTSDLKMARRSESAHIEVTEWSAVYGKIPTTCGLRNRQDLHVRVMNWPCYHLVI